MKSVQDLIADELEAVEGYEEYLINQHSVKVKKTIEKIIKAEKSHIKLLKSKIFQGENC